MQASSLSITSAQPVKSTSPAGGPPSSSLGSLGATQALGIGAVRVASTVVTNVMRPVISTPLPIASKPRDGGPPSSPHPLERKSLTPQQQHQILIGPGGGGAGPPATAGGYYSSSSTNPVGAGGVVTNLVLGGALPAQSAVQLISPSPHPQSSHQQAIPSTAVSASHSQNNGPLSLLQPQFLPGSPLAPPGGKAITQVQYILPTLPARAKSPPQNLSQPTSIFSLPTAPQTHVSLANGKQQGAGLQTGYTSSPTVGVVSPGARGKKFTHRSRSVSCFLCNAVFCSPCQCKPSLRCSRAKCLFPWQQFGQRKPLPSSFPLLLHPFRSRMVHRREARSESTSQRRKIPFFCFCFNLVVFS